MNRAAEPVAVLAGIVVGVERGTPLADVLRAKAQDIRETGRRAVMDEGGRKEIPMMVAIASLPLFGEARRFVSGAASRGL